MGREFLVGMSMGILLNLFFQAVHFGGDLIGRTAGYAAAESFNPSLGDMGGPIGELMHIVLVMIFLLTNGHLFFIASLDLSYVMVPIGSFAVGHSLTLVVNEAANQLFTIGLALAFPVLSSTLAVTVAEGVIARAVPQINILMISFATKILVFLVIMLTGLPVVVAFMALVIHAMQAFLLKAMPSLTGI
jgi:flagellar biosynthetic protein FliR